MARTTTLEERCCIVDYVQAGLNDGDIAAKMNRSIHTVRKWRRRFNSGGRAALASTMGRPLTGAMSTFAAPIRQTVLQWRNDHPGWGTKTIHSQLRQESAWAEGRLPSPATIGRLLKAEALTRHYHRHSALPEPPRLPVTVPHQRWQLDAQGNEQVPDLGTVSLINLIDTSSRVRLLSYPCALERPQSHPTTVDYQTALRLAFSHWGLPRQLQFDHESVFFDSTSKSPYPTRLHLWLSALGIEVVFSQGPPPNEQAIVERSHQLWFEQVVNGARFACWGAFYEALLRRREFLNSMLPCATLGEQPPLLAYPEARHSGRWYRPEIEAALLDLGRVDAYLGQGRWYRLASKDATVRLGGQVYYVGVEQKRMSLEITYDGQARQLCFHNAAGQEVTRRAIKGVSQEALLGAMEPYVNLPSFQLQLPFRWSDQGVIRLCEHMGGDTS